METLLIFGGNPVYDAPADLNFLQEFKQVKVRFASSGCIPTKPPHGATGTFRRLIIWNPGATRGLMMAQSPWSSH